MNQYESSAEEWDQLETLYAQLVHEYLVVDDSNPRRYVDRRTNEQIDCYYGKAESSSLIRSRGDIDIEKSNPGGREF